MAEYTYITADIKTGLPKAEIPFSGVKWSRALNGPGGFEGKIDVRHPKATRANLDPARTLLYVLRGDQPMWAGIIWEASMDAGSLTVTGQGIWSYFRRRNIRHTRTFKGVNQLAIARSLIDYAQSSTFSPGGDIGVVVGSETGGPSRDRTYPGYERKPIGEAVEQLAAVIDGFDFSIETTSGVGGSGLEFTNTFKLWYPRRGRRTNFKWEVGIHCDLNEWELDATRQATQMDALGAGEGDSMLIAPAVSTHLLDIYPLLDYTVSVRDVSRMNTLASHANYWLVRRQLPIAHPSITLRDSKDTRVGSFIDGDEIRLVGTDGWAELDGWYRIVQYEVAVSDEGDERVKIDFQGAEAMP